MHEVALGEQLARVVTKAAAGRTVYTVVVEVGALRQVVPPALQQAWQVLIKGTPLAQAKLDLQLLPGVLRCPAGHETVVAEQYTRLCGSCDLPAQVIQGLEFRVVELELER